MAVRIVHGANEEVFDIQCRSVGDFRRALSQSFNIPAAAEAFVAGELVTDDQILRDGEVLEFVRVHGVKGLGALLTPDELRELWQITDEQYGELIVLGLPALRFQSGGVRHPEMALDEFFRQHSSHEQRDCPEISLTERVVDAIEKVAERLPNLAGPPMTVEQVAQFASISTKSVYRWVGQGRLKPKADHSRPLLFDRNEVEKALTRAT